MSDDKMERCPFCGHETNSSRYCCRNEECFLFLVEAEEPEEWNTRPIEDGLRAELKELQFVADRFGQWYSDNGCPWSEHQFCPNLDELKKEYDEDMKDEPEDERCPFCPSDDCGREMSEGDCYVEYYKKLFREREGTVE